MPNISAGAAAPAAGEGHLGYLDGWRGLAMLLVLVGHFTSLGQAGNLGVELFFVLSGRLMAEILIVRRQPIGSFLRRRASRILPALFFYVAAISTIGLAAATPEGTRLIAGSAAATLLFVQNYLPEHWVAGVFQHCWSLAVEEHSYLALAIVALAAARRPRAAMKVAAALALCGIAIGIWQTSAGAAHIYGQSHVRGASICMSFALFLWLRGRAEGVRPLPAWTAPVALLLGIAIGLAVPSETLRYTIGTLLLAIAVNSVDGAPAAFRRLLEEPVLRWIGLISFSLYLWQQPFFIAYRDGAALFETLPLVFLCAACSFYGIETPARRFLNGLGARPAGVPARA